MQKMYNKSQNLLQIMYQTTIQNAGKYMNPIPVIQITNRYKNIQMADNEFFGLLGGLRNHYFLPTCAKRCLAGCIIRHLTQRLGAIWPPSPGFVFGQVLGPTFGGFGAHFGGQNGAQNPTFSGCIF